MPFSSLYGKFSNLRNRFYDRRFFKSARLGATTISVGNITVGGTGKTPLVAYLAELLAKNGRKVCIISRGYKRQNATRRTLVSDGEKILTDVSQAGDEPFELAQKLLGKAIVIADADRVSAARWARENFEISAFILDDAFQHRRAERDLDLVVIDATNPFGNRKTLPFGILREPLENLRRADLIVITRTNLASEIELEKLETEISTLADAPIFRASNKISHFISIEDFHKIANPKSQIPNPNYFAFCALGNPHNFFAQLRRENFEIKGTKTFPDHHFYSAEDLAEIEREARRTNADTLLTTAKDAVKINASNLSMPCLVAESKLVFDHEKALRELINAELSPKSKI